MLEERREGLFVVFEGIDGSGTSSNVIELVRLLEELDKYQDVIRTHEPWRKQEIKEILEKDTDVYSNAEEILYFLLGDRTDHTYEIIKPNLLAGAVVGCSRYKMSTCAFQQAQGIPLNRLLKLHEHRGIIKPDLTFFLDVEKENAARRFKDRKKREKFEKDPEFVDKVIANYRELIELSKKDESLFGRVETIDANKPLEEVVKAIRNIFVPFYERWKGINFQYTDILVYNQKWAKSRQ